MWIEGHSVVVARRSLSWLRFMISGSCLARSLALKFCICTRGFCAAPQKWLIFNLQSIAKSMCNSGLKGFTWRLSCIPVTTPPIYLSGSTVGNKTGLHVTYDWWMQNADSCIRWQISDTLLELCIAAIKVRGLGQAFHDSLSYTAQTFLLWSLFITMTMPHFSRNFELLFN